MRTAAPDGAGIHDPDLSPGLLQGQPGSESHHPAADDQNVQFFVHCRIPVGYFAPFTHAFARFGDVSVTNFAFRLRRNMTNQLNPP
jgi:hypothetical protein